MPSLCLAPQKQQASQTRIRSGVCHGQILRRGQRLRKHLVHMLWRHFPHSRFLSPHFFEKADAHRARLTTDNRPPTTGYCVCCNCAISFCARLLSDSDHSTRPDNLTFFCTAIVNATSFATLYRTC